MYIIICLINSGASLYGQSTPKDTTLPLVTTISGVTSNGITTAYTIQTLTQADIRQTGSLSVGDAAKYFSGVIVKDYGGVGGLKTVSIRSLGASHTGVLYDGIIMPAAQGGQIDLGLFSVNNLYSMSLQNAQPSEILNTARSFASGALLMLETGTAQAVKRGSAYSQVSLKAGSFALFNPNVQVAYKWTDKWTATGNVDITTTKGNYPFVDYVNNNLRLHRTNSDVKSIIAETNILYRDSLKNNFDFKVYFSGSDRGLPGGIIYENFYSAERLSDKNFFLQSRFKKNIAQNLQLLVSARYTYLFDHYKDPGTPGMNNPYENIFSQYEYYLSASAKYNFLKYWAVSYSVDYFYTDLFRKDSFAVKQFFPGPSRNTVLNNVAVKADFGNTLLQASLLHSFIENKTKTGDAGKSINEFTPTISALFQPFNNLPLRVRAFYKNIFRAPSFEDLYYTNIGNTKLRPEYVNQYNLGLTYVLTGFSFLKRVGITVDAYYNRVKDKIIAVPRENLFEWSMQNLGKVAINGADAAMEVVFINIKNWQVESNLTYTYQKAIDLTDPASTVYKQQIPYTPKHSGSLRLSCTNKLFTIAYNMLASSYRYRSGEVLKDNYLAGWLTHNLFASYTIKAKGAQLDFFSELNNISNSQYEIVKYYPMPGFNYRIGVNVRF